MDKDTIGAISTGMTNSGIAIVKIVGDEALWVVDKIFKGRKKISEQESHTIHYGHIVDKDAVIDEVLVSVMKAPRTYTGEDTVEINCHGGPFVVNKVLELVIRSGARLAEPGEITKRAFLNGKMDLSQSEAVIDIINAKNDYALKNSLNQLKGSVKNAITRIREIILYQTASIEAMLDDPENYEDPEFNEKLRIVIGEETETLTKLIKHADEGKVLTEGIQTVIIGKPNVGKSSLLNVLAGKERAIVTEIEGTTRDALEESLSLGGLSLNVVDTAGIRETENIIERMGVDKAKEYVEKSDLIVFVVDASKEIDSRDEEIIRILKGKKVIVLLNKTDLKSVVSVEAIQEKFCEAVSLEKRDCMTKEKKNLQKGSCRESAVNKKSNKEAKKVVNPEQETPPGEKMRENSGANAGKAAKTAGACEFVGKLAQGDLATLSPPVIEVSAKEEQGIGEFVDKLKELFIDEELTFNDEVFVSSMRQKEVLAEALESLRKVIESIDSNLSEDFFAIDLMDAYQVLGKITGETIGEDLINEIFGKFCMGK